MAVYTTVSESQVNQMLSGYGLPPLLHMQGAAEGIENTTYFLKLTDQQEYVLTLFEHSGLDDLLPYAAFTRYLHDKNLPVAAPIADQQGGFVQNLDGKALWLVQRAPGSHCLCPGPAECEQIGQALAHCHQLAQQYSHNIANPCGLEWLTACVQQLRGDLAADDLTLLDAQLTNAHRLQTLAMPRAIIHGDLFRDNALFVGQQLSAIIDFNNAGVDFLLLDLAIVANDWCTNTQGDWSDELQLSLWRGYQSIRPLEPVEQQHWPRMLQLAACRFWVSRLLAQKAALQHGQQSPKDPQSFKKLLQKHLL